MTGKFLVGVGLLALVLPVLSPASAAGLALGALLGLGVR